MYQVMYVTATSPYILMLVLLIRSALLPGAVEGIKFYMIPEFEKLKELEVTTDSSNILTHVFMFLSSQLKQ